MNRPIIIGGNHHNTLGVIRALGYKGITSLVVLVTEEEKPYVSYSKYIDSCVLLRNSQDVVPFLLEYQKDIQGKQVVLSCADFATAELDKHYDELEKYYYLPTSHKQGRCNHYMNKEEMSRLAVSKGMKAPKSWTIEPKTQINISEVKFPCIAKPLVSIFGSKLEIQILRNKEELLSYLDEYKDHRFFLQEFIEKDFEYQLIGCSLRNGEEVIIPGYSKCIRPCQGTNTGFLEYKAFGGFLCNLQACANFIKEIGYQGLFSMEFIRDKKGVDYFLEINMRNDGNAICVTGAGVNLPFIYLVIICAKREKEQLFLSVPQASSPLHVRFIRRLVLKEKILFILMRREF